MINDTTPNIVLNDIIQIDKRYTPEYIKVICILSNLALKYTIYFAINSKLLKIEREVTVFDHINILARILKIVQTYYYPIIANNITKESLTKKVSSPNFTTKEVIKENTKITKFEILSTTQKSEITVYNAFNYTLNNNYLEIFIRKRNYIINENL